jgi:flagellar operon protein
MNPISNPALTPPGGLAGVGGTVAPAGGAQGPAAPPGAAARKAPGAAKSGPSFADTLAQAGQAAGGLQFSKHARDRIERRGIELDPTTLGRLSQGVGRAAGKGSRDSLVLVDGTAFVVSVSNRTVITAVGAEHMKDNVFTNIDSAVIA